MRLLFSISAAVLGLAVAAGAQDTTVKSRTTVKADDAKVMTMTGCLRHNPSGEYTLAGGILAAGDDLKTKSKVKTDVDKDDITVKGKTQIKGDDAVATSGVTSTYALVPGSVDLSPHVGHQVQISAIAVEAGHADADVKIKDKTTVDPEHASDATTRSKTKIEVPKSPLGSYSVVSVKPMPGACPLE